VARHSWNIKFLCAISDTFSEEKGGVQARQILSSWRPSENHNRQAGSHCDEKAWKQQNLSCQWKTLGLTQLLTTSRWRSLEIVMAETLGVHRTHCVVCLRWTPLGYRLSPSVSCWWAVFKERRYRVRHWRSAIARGARRRGVLDYLCVSVTCPSTSVASGFKLLTAGWGFVMVTDDAAFPWENTAWSFDLAFLLSLEHPSCSGDLSFSPWLRPAPRSTEMGGDLHRPRMMWHSPKKHGMIFTSYFQWEPVSSYFTVVISPLDRMIPGERTNCQKFGEKEGRQVSTAGRV